MSVAYAAGLLRRYAQQQTLGQCLIKDARATHEQHTCLQLRLGSSSLD